MSIFIFFIIGILINVYIRSAKKSAFYIGYEKGYNDHPYDVDKAHNEYLMGDYE